MAVLIVGALVLLSGDDHLAPGLRTGILGYTFVTSDDGQFALVEFVAAQRSALNEILAALLQSIQTLGHVEFQDKIDVDHPEIHAALTSGLVAMEKCKEIDLLSRYASRLQRDYRNALKDLESRQALRKQHEQKELQEAALLRRFHQMDEIPFRPAEFGFVLPLPRIDAYNRRQLALEKALVARDHGFNREKYQAAVRN